MDDNIFVFEAITKDVFRGQKVFQVASEDVLEDDIEVGDVVTIEYRTGINCGYHVAVINGDDGGDE